jgi:Putative  PD-(D/E)XK family member, (DUF4420)
MANSAMIVRTTMTPLDKTWRDLVADGVPFSSQRVDAAHPLDLFASVNATLDPGLVLLSTVEPPLSPGLDAIEITVSQREDGTWALGLWLTRPLLAEVFLELCDDLVDSSRNVEPAQAAAFLLARIQRWRRLFELGKGLLSPSEIRGLIGELLILQQLTDHWSAEEAVTGWVGPLEAPQDFVLPGLRVEVKANIPSSRTVHISSLEQLDVDDPTILAVVTLASSTGGGEALTLPMIVKNTLDVVRMRGTLGDVDLFERRLRGARYQPDPAYDKLAFRVHQAQFFTIGADFPRIRRSDVAAGVHSGSYDILLATIRKFSTTVLRPSWN